MNGVISMTMAESRPNDWREPISRAVETWKTNGDVSPKSDPYLKTSNNSDVWRLTMWTAYHHGLTRLPKFHKSRGDSWILETSSCSRLKVKVNYDATDHREYATVVGYA